jgi:hypothetical protein
MLEIGIVLLLVGLVGLIFGISKETTQVTASHGSVAVKGNKNAINNTVSTDKTPSSFWDVWNIVCGLATLAGLILAIIAIGE